MMLKESKNLQSVRQRTSRYLPQSAQVSDEGHPARNCGAHHPSPLGSKGKETMTFTHDLHPQRKTAVLFHVQCKPTRGHQPLDAARAARTHQEETRQLRQEGGCPESRPPTTSRPRGETPALQGRAQGRTTWRGLLCGRKAALP